VGLSGYVVVCHDDDEGYAGEVAGFLTAHGIPVRHHHPATGHVAGARAVVVVLGPDRPSRRLRHDLALATRLGVWIFPLVRGGIPPAEIAGLPYEDVADGRMPRPVSQAALRRLVTGPDPGPEPGVAGTARHRWRLVLTAGATVLALALGTALLALLDTPR
jgi:hypothetical protein